MNLIVKDAYKINSNSTSQICPELGPELMNIQIKNQDHPIQVKPQCLERVLPTLTIYTKKNVGGCNLTSGIPEDASLYFKDMGRCTKEISQSQQIIFIVHGFLQEINVDVRTWLGGFLKMKDELLKADDGKRKGVIIVNWTKGHKTDPRFLKSRENLLLHLLEAVLYGLPYHQAAANTRYVGASIAVIAKEIK